MRILVELRIQCAFLCINAYDLANDHVYRDAFANANAVARFSQYSLRHRLPVVSLSWFSSTPDRDVTATESDQVGQRSPAFQA